jgi:hypothetical protein
MLASRGEVRKGINNRIVVMRIRYSKRSIAVKSKHRTVSLGRGQRALHFAQMAGLFVSVLLLSVVQTPAQAQVIYNPANGHYYEIVVPNVLLTWEGNKIDAHNRTHMGLRGHIATLTSAQEDQFITTNMPAAVFYTLQLGAYQDLNAPDYSEPAGGWRWVTGEPMIYTDWYQGGPNNAGGNENYMAFFPNGQWNDYDGSSPGGYVMSTSPTPIFSTTILMGTARPIWCFRTSPPIRSPSGT